MQSDPRGFCSARLLSANGWIAEVPYRIPQQGLLISSASAQVIVAVLPIAAVEDPRFGPALTRNGLYRVEDQSAKVARIGQGRILDRVRRHRSTQVVVPHRLICAVPREAEWTIGDRCYLETRWAGHWRLAGHALASSVFVTSFPSLGAKRRAYLDTCLSEIIELAGAGGRLIDGDTSGEFQPCDDDKWLQSSMPSSSPADGYHRTYPVGTRLVYEVGAIMARALVQVDAVVLEPESLVRLELGTSVGFRFAETHQAFLAAAEVIALDGRIGRTTVPFAALTAAALIKRVSGGRVHNSDRWQPYPRRR